MRFKIEKEMRLHLATIWLVLLAMLTFFPAHAQDTQKQPKFDEYLVLSVRHPEIVKNKSFQTWLKTHAVGPWYESVPVNSISQVVIQDPHGENIFAARIKESNKSVLQTTTVNLVTYKATRMQTFSNFTKSNADKPIVALRPIVSFLADGKINLLWEIDAGKKEKLEVFRTDGEKFNKTYDKATKLPLNLKSTNLIPPAAEPPPPPDETGDNELHHLAAFGLEAHGWIAGATTVEEKARRIFNRVNAAYTYNSTILHISEFTWADYLTRDANGRAGICDEWAVAEISYLRSVGIPARLKFLIWKMGAEIQGHAAVEYLDGGTWKHMDALWRAFNNPAIYRQNGATSVTVMDADYPLDSRYTGSAWGIPDVSGDAKLYPYGDFIIAPAYPGNSRPGYSN